MTQRLVNILLVEDDEVDVMNVKRAFSKNNIKNPLYVAGNGVEALEMLDDKIIPLPKIIILDINMPKMNGIEFLKVLRENERLKNISVFVMTTSNEDSDKIKAYNLNVAGYILKPLSFEKFVVSVSTLNNFWQLCEM
ncbi:MULTISPECIES: response regulator [Flavobacterium]|uniref:Response regulator n=1 Tax=Flavobacterium gawalongense TaxID=2594432 RepID=A0A553BRC9_9FLAO|nr:response regulator [Flavobacterium gawalongense]TRX03466.1 response regulator [Flavobacterium gawalongense]TRX06765.1 response regulator [Flavobacterium gawalongense]TRX10814.1 response regulator [Flavobacterium gawalongense]TRX11536.1 response regulator [Flavobacterium gawalongense]TRX29306.1 response regulator [Flavobacterium gawalongense]